MDRPSRDFWRRVFDTDNEFIIPDILDTIGSAVDVSRMYPSGKGTALWRHFNNWNNTGDQILHYLRDAKAARERTPAQSARIDALISSVEAEVGAIHAGQQAREQVQQDRVAQALAQVEARQQAQRVREEQQRSQQQSRRRTREGALSSDFIEEQFPSSKRELMFAIDREVNDGSIFPRVETMEGTYRDKQRAFFNILRAEGITLDSLAEHVARLEQAQEPQPAPAPETINENEIFRQIETENAVRALSERIVKEFWQKKEAILAKRRKKKYTKQPQTRTERAKIAEAATEPLEAIREVEPDEEAEEQCSP
jgi:uncharacterized FlaG/YvyC family protein